MTGKALVEVFSHIPMTCKDR